MSQANIEPKILEQIKREGVSIVMGGRNEFPQVAMTITNLAEDLYQHGIENYEIILMDNGSEDETSRFFTWKPVSKGYWDQYQRSPRGLVNEGKLRIYFDPVLSNVGTRNKGTRLAKYENIVFSDAHMIVRNGAIPYMLETLIKNNGGIVHAPIAWMGASSERPVPGMQYTYKVGEKIWGCVDEETELLTFHGWKKHNEVSKDTIFATVNRKSKLIEYQLPSKITKYDYDDEAIHISNNQVDMLLTPDHRTLVNDFSIIPAKSVKPGDRIPISSGGVGKHTAFQYNPGYLAVLGWVLTDGGYDAKGKRLDRVRIFQKKKKQVEIIREDLEESGLAYTERVDKEGKHIFSLRVKDSRDIINRFPNRCLTIEFIHSLSTEEARYLIHRMMLADGGDNKVFYKTDKEYSDLFQMLCVHAGISSKSKYNNSKKFLDSRYGNEGIHNISVGRELQYKLKIKRVNYKGVMWCPTVPNGTIVARRNGKVYLTGQTWIKTAVSETEPYFIPFCGHAFIAVRRKQFLKYRGYPEDQRVYGGGEPYLDTKYWMLGSHSMMDPRALTYHLSFGRGYNWHSNDLLHNMFLVSYILGGEKWSDRILMTYYNNPGANKNIVKMLHDEALEEGQVDHAWLQKYKQRTFEEVVGLDREDEIIKMTKEEKSEIEADWWCNTCTKRGYPDPHIMRPWDIKNQEKLGNHRSFVGYFALTEKEGKYYIGNTLLKDEDAIKLAQKYI